jgi:hypothetical protein
MISQLIAFLIRNLPAVLFVAAVIVASSYRHRSVDQVVTWLIVPAIVAIVVGGGGVWLSRRIP